MAEPVKSSSYLLTEDGTAPYTINLPSHQTDQTLVVFITTNSSRTITSLTATCK